MSKSIISLVVMILALGPALWAQGRGPAAPPALPSQSQGRGAPAIPASPGPGLHGPEAPAGAHEIHAAGEQPTAVDQLARTPHLAERLAGMLTLPEGTTLEDAADGFPNFGLFVAAVQVSNNVEGTTFDGLKSRLTGEDPMSLGEAIDDETGLSAEEAAAAAAEAEAQAEELVEEQPE